MQIRRNIYLTDPTARRLMKPQGVGPLIATAFVTSLGDGQPFRKGRVQ